MGIHTAVRIGGSPPLPKSRHHGTPRTSSVCSVPSLNKRVKVERENSTALDLASLPTKDLLAVARHLHPRCMVSLSLTCRVFSEKKYAHEMVAKKSLPLSLVECAALEETAEMTEQERRTLYVRGSMISAYDQLLKHRARLEFTMLVGRRIRYAKKRDKSTLNAWNSRRGGNTAVARDFVMRRGRHFTRFRVRALQPPQPGDDVHVGVVRPISRRILDNRKDEFSPFQRDNKLELLAADGKQTQEWEDDSGVQVSRVFAAAFPSR